MAWDKDLATCTLIDPDTGELDTALHVVEYQPVDDAYPAGKIACTQLSSLHTYKPNSDLDENMHYWVYIDTVKSYKLIAFNSIPAIGG